MIIRGSGKFKAVRVHYAPGLPQKMAAGERGYMNRGVWPYQVLFGDEVVTNPRQMRHDYVPVETLAGDKTAIVFRTNIPMNLGAAWHENGVWHCHPVDKIPENSPAIIMDPAHNSLYAQPDTKGIHPDSIALLTPCLGVGSFNPDLYIRGTPDLRLVVNLSPVWPKEEQTWGSVANHPSNRLLTSLQALFTYDRDLYVERVKAAIQEYGWGRYNRTVIALSTTSHQPWEIYCFGDKVTAEEVFKAVLKETAIKNPVVFSLVEGGSFGVGLIYQGGLHDLTVPADYYRGPKGLWCGILEVEDDEAVGIFRTRFPGKFEIEAKFEVPDLTIFNGIEKLRSLAGFQADPPETKIQTDTYYDSPHLDFYNKHLGTLRLRESGGKYKITLKQPTGKKGEGKGRLEFEETISEEVIPKLHDHEYFIRAGKILGAEKIVPILKVITERTIILFGSGEEKIEVAMDRVRYQTLQGEESDLEFELEIENKGCSPEKFEEFVGEFKRLFLGLKKSKGAKYERGIQRLGLGGQN